MKNIILVPELREIIALKNWNTFREIADDLYPVEMADFISALEPKEIWTLLKELDTKKRSEIFSHLELSTQIEVTEHLDQRQLADLLMEMSPDDRVDLFKRFPEEKQETIFRALAQAEREDIRRLASYPERSAGSVMTSEYVSLPANITVQEAIGRLRLEAPKKETIDYNYITDEQRRLIGFVSLRDLIMADPHALIQTIMHREVLYVAVEEDQEAAAKIIQKYDLTALPVTDADNRLVGIITHDDILDIVTQEQTEDFEKFMAITGSHEAGVYLKKTVWTHFKNRAIWIVSLAALGLISGLIVHSFENTLTNLMILALYMPMVADTGGNTGSQSATVIVRALALNELSFRDMLKVFWKELRISVLLALVLGVLSWGKVMFLSQGSDIPFGYSLFQIGNTIAVALSLQVITATLIGALLPLLAARFRLDPAVIASPALTTIVDITGLLLYFTTAKLLLGI